jgi:hypothetical protein
MSLGIYGVGREWFSIAGRGTLCTRCGCVIFFVVWMCALFGLVHIFA